MERQLRPAARAYSQSSRIIHTHKDDEEEDEEDEEEYCDEEEGPECYSLPEEGDPGYYEPQEGDPGYHEPEEGDEDYYEPQEGDEGYKEPEEEDDEDEDDEPEVPPFQDLPPVIFPPFFHFPYPDTSGPTPEPGSGAGKTLVAQPQIPGKRNFTGNFQFDDDLVQWYAYSGACIVCLVNMLVGAQPQGTIFPSGHEEPPAHPNCRCNLETVDIYDHAVNQQSQGIFFDIGVEQ